MWTWIIALGVVYFLIALGTGFRGYPGDPFSAVLFALGSAGLPFTLVVAFLLAIRAMFPYRPVRLFCTICGATIIAVGIVVQLEAWGREPEALMGVLLQWVLLMIGGVIALIWGVVIKLRSGP